MSSKNYRNQIFIFVLIEVLNCQINEVNFKHKGSWKINLFLKKLFEIHPCFIFADFNKIFEYRFKTRQQKLFRINWNPNCAIKRRNCSFSSNTFAVRRIINSRMPAFFDLDERVFIAKTFIIFRSHLNNSFLLWQTEIRNVPLKMEQYKIC